eukprot:gene3270-2411_t
MILSFLWFSEFRELLLTARDINEYVGRDDLLHRQLISLLSYFTGRLASPLDDVFFESRPSFREILSLASRFSTWPLVAVVGTPHVDSRRRERYGLTRVTCDGQECVLFTGNRGRDRAFFSDDHFPVTGHCGNLSATDEQVFSPALLPFAKPYCLPGEGPRRGHVLSCVSYYEIAIFPPQEPAPRRAQLPPFGEEFVPPPCVCIGMARPGFNAFNMQPGWDENSFALHGDDGLLYCCGDGSEHVEVETDADTRFGVGDTVGLGLIHGLTRAMLFFTKNGRLTGFHQPTDADSRELARYPWFAAVGLDCYCPIACNFGAGDRPFAFDVRRFEEQLKALDTDAKLRAWAAQLAAAVPLRHCQTAAALVGAVWAAHDQRAAPPVAPRAALSDRQQRLHAALRQRRTHPWFFDLRAPWRGRGGGEAPFSVAVAAGGGPGEPVSRFFNARLSLLVRNVVHHWLRAALQRLERQLRATTASMAESAAAALPTDAAADAQPPSTSTLLRRLRLLPPQAILQFLQAQRRSEDAAAPSAAAQPSATAFAAPPPPPPPAAGPAYFQTAAVLLARQQQAQPEPEPALALEPLLAPAAVDEPPRWTDDGLISAALRSASLRELAQLQQAAFLDALRVAAPDATAAAADSDDGDDGDDSDDGAAQSPKRPRL